MVARKDQQILEGKNTQILFEQLMLKVVKTFGIK